MVDKNHCQCKTVLSQSLCQLRSLKNQIIYVYNQSNIQHIPLLL